MTNVKNSLPYFSAREHYKKKYAGLGGNRDSMASKKSSGSVTSSGVKAFIKQNKDPSISVSRACSIAMPNKLGQIKNESSVKFNNSRNPSISMSLGASLRQR